MQACKREREEKMKTYGRVSSIVSVCWDGGSVGSAA